MAEGHPLVPTEVVVFFLLEKQVLVRWLSHEDQLSIFHNWLLLDFALYFHGLEMSSPINQIQQRFP